MAPRGGDRGGRKPTLPPGLARTEHLSFRAFDDGSEGNSTGRPLSPAEVRSLAGFARRILAGALAALDGNDAHGLPDDAFNAINIAWQILDDAGL